MSKEQLVERIVTTHKGFLGPAPDGNPRKRKRYKYGERIQVRLSTANAFKESLTDPAVLDAQAKAAEAVRQAEAAAAKAKANEEAKTAAAPQANQTKQQ